MTVSRLHGVRMAGFGPRAFAVPKPSTATTQVQFGNRNTQRTVLSLVALVSLLGLALPSKPAHAGENNADKWVIHRDTPPLAKDPVDAWLAQKNNHQGTIGDGGTVSSTDDTSDSDGPGLNLGDDD